MNGLIISDSSPLQMRFSSLLKQITKLPPDLANSSRHALDLVKAHKNYKIIICIHPLDNHIQELFDYLITQNLFIPVLFTANDHDISLLHSIIPKSKNVSVISFEKDETIIINIINRLLRAREKGIIELPQLQYLKINIDLFKDMPMISHDLYIQCFDNVFQKIFYAFQPLNNSLIDRYRGYKYFYVELNEFPSASYHILKAQLAHSAVFNESVLWQTELLILAYHSLYLGICQYGLNQRSMELLETCRKLIANLAKHTSLENFLKADWDFENSQTKCSCYLAFVTLNIIPHISFTADKKYQDIFILASLLHDIGLLPDRKKHTQNEDEQDDDQHPKDTLDIISVIDDLPSEVEKIIAQHHEEIDGSGFPMHLKHNMITPLAQIFIVARHFTESICSLSKDSIDTNIVIESLDKYYQHGYFKMAKDALKAALQGIN